MEKETIRKQQSEIAKLQKSLASLATAESERLDLKRRYVELGERFEALYLAEQAKRETSEQQAAQAVHALSQQLQSVLAQAEIDREISAVKLKAAEESASQLSDSLASTQAKLMTSDARVLRFYTSLIGLPGEISRVKSDLAELGQTLRSERELLQASVKLRETSTVDLREALSTALTVDFTETDFADTNTLTLKIAAAVTSKTSFATHALRTEFVKLKEETVSLRDAWLTERAEAERVIDSLNRKLTLPVSPVMDSFEVEKLGRECQRLNELLDSRELQLSQLMTSRQEQLRASFSAN